MPSTFFVRRASMLFVYGSKKMRKKVMNDQKNVSSTNEANIILCHKFLGKKILLVF
jgi:hypothetical protein